MSRCAVSLNPNKRRSDSNLFCATSNVSLYPTWHKDKNNLIILQFDHLS